MADDKNLNSKVGLDTTDFKTGVAALNRELRVVESGFKASAAALGDWSKDASGLEMRVKALNSEMEIQGKKVEATRGEYQKMVETYGANSKAAQDMEIRLNKETETLGKMQSELNDTDKALSDMSQETEDTTQSVDDLGEKSSESVPKLDKLKGALDAVGKVAKAVAGIMMAVVGAVAAIGVAIGGLVLNTAKSADELSELSDKTGIGVEKLQEMAFAGELLGVSLDTMTGAQAKLVRSMNTGRDGTGAQAEAFAKLGLKVTDAGGNLRDTQTVFGETIDALKKISNPAERDALAMELFGKSAMELNPLIKAGSSGLAELATKAHESGAIMSTESVEAAAAFQDQLDILVMGMKGTAGTIATALIPAFSPLATQAQGYLSDLVGIVKGSNGDISKIVAGIGTLIGRIAADLAKQAPAMLQAGLGLLKSIIDAMLSALPQLLPAVVQIITTLVTFLVQNLPLLIDAGFQIIRQLVDAILPQLPMLIDAALGIIVELANGLADALPALVPTIAQVMVQIVNVLIENLPLLIDASLQLILALTQGLIAAIPILIPAIPKIIEAIIDALIIAGPQIALAAGQLIGMLASGLSAAGYLIISAMKDLVKLLFKPLPKNLLLDIGKNLIEGLWLGIKTAWAVMLEQFAELVEMLPDAVKSVLGIASPSKVGIKLGKNFGDSLGQGMFPALDEVRKGLANSMGGLATPSMAGAVAGVTNSVKNDNFGFSNYGTVVFQGAQSPGSLANTIKGKRY